MCLAAVIRPDAPAPQGQESLAQGLPWVSRHKAFRPEGARAAHAIRFKDSEPILAEPSGPFMANLGGGISQGKPWAIAFLATSGHTDWNLQTPSGRVMLNRYLVGP
jgi:hypothetical protein